MPVNPQTALEAVLARLQDERARVVAEKEDLQTREDIVVDRLDEVDLHIDAVEAALAALP